MCVAAGGGEGAEGGAPAGDGALEEEGMLVRGMVEGVRKVLFVMGDVL